MDRSRLGAPGSAPPVDEREIGAAHAQTPQVQGDRGVLRSPPVHRGSDRAVARGTRKPATHLRRAPGGTLPPRGDRSLGAAAIGTRRSDLRAAHAGPETSRTDSQTGRRSFRYGARVGGAGSAPPTI